MSPLYLEVAGCARPLIVDISLNPIRYVVNKFCCRLRNFLHSVSSFEMCRAESFAILTRCISRETADR
jgi:hypothetical protein